MFESGGRWPIAGATCVNLMVIIIDAQSVRFFVDGCCDGFVPTDDTPQCDDFIARGACCFFDALALTNWQWALDLPAFFVYVVLFLSDGDFLSKQNVIGRFCAVRLERRAFCLA